MMSLDAWSAPRPLAEWVHEQGASAAGIRFQASLEINEKLHEPGLQVVVERHLGAAIRWNGYPLATNGATWFDPDWLCYQVPADIVRRGINEVEAELGVRNDAGHMENMYIIGDFAVLIRDGTEPFIKQAGGTVNEPEADLSEQGYPFYAGSMEFSFSLDDLASKQTENKPSGKWLCD